MASSCPVCGGNDIDQLNSSSRTCITCGFVLDADDIDTKNVEIGADEKVCQTRVIYDHQPALSWSVGNFHRRPNASRELTLAKARKDISALATRLGLENTHSDQANRLFRLALQHNFLRGRSREVVIAACLYIVCRRMHSPVLLIDFSEALKINLYVLGSTYLKFRRLLNLNSMPIIDPSLFIRRFASKLEFDDKVVEVSNMALKLVARMKRDWMQVGRRPSGICGASLLIAARSFGFRRTQKEISRVVHICESTLRTRLTEFCNTSAASLTFEEFNKQEITDIEKSQAADPPAFARLRQAEEERRKTLTLKESEEEKEIGGLITLALKDASLKEFTVAVTDGDEKKESSSQLLLKFQRHHEAIQNKAKEERQRLEEAKYEEERLEWERQKREAKRSQKRSHASAMSDLVAVSMSGKQEEEEEEEEEVVDEEDEDEGGVGRSVKEEVKKTKQEKKEGGDEEKEETGGGKEEAEEEEAEEEEEEEEGLVELFIDDLDEKEMDAYILQDSVSSFKTIFWEKMHQGWLDEQTKRRELEAKENPTKKPAANTFKRRKFGQRSLAAGSAAEATKNMLQEKKLSSRVNYNALSSLFDETTVVVKQAGDAMDDDDLAAATATSHADIVRAKLEKSEGGDSNSMERLRKTLASVDSDDEAVDFLDD